MDVHQVKTWVVRYPLIPKGRLKESKTTTDGTSTATINLIFPHKITHNSLQGRGTHSASNSLYSEPSPWPFCHLDRSDKSGNRGAAKHLHKYHTQPRQRQREKDADQPPQPTLSRPAINPRKCSPFRWWRRQILNTFCTEHWAMGNTRRQQLLVVCSLQFRCRCCGYGSYGLAGPITPAFGSPDTRTGRLPDWAGPLDSRTEWFSVRNSPK